ncbi:MAG: CmcI family methyltransferase, partial [Aquihabitans sp.]
DGDHNWYTVFHELQELDRTARAASQPLPVLVLHDVAWPYGHRDLYYEPSQIPDEFRQPWDRAGMAPGHYRLVPEGGFNVELANAIDGGGPRNGVMKALEDFLESYDRPYRLMVLPFYYGLAVVIDEERLDSCPELSHILDHWEGAAGRLQLLKLSERIRIDEQVHVHNWNRVLEGKADVQRRRYLELLKSALLDVHYLDNEVRVDYLANLPEGVEPDVALLRDPARSMPFRYQPLSQARRAGRSTDGPRTSAFFPYTDMGRVALDHLEKVVGTLAQDPVDGDVVECGVGRGGGSIFLRGGLDAYELGERTVWVVDPFMASDLDTPKTGDPLAARLARLRADLSQVRDGFEKFDLLTDGVRFVQGPYRESLGDAPVGPIAILRLGESLGAELPVVLTQLLPKVSQGGAVIIEGVGLPRIDALVSATLARLGVTAPIERVDWNTISWRADAPVPLESGEERDQAPQRVAVPASRDDEAIDLSVVVIFYDMAREAERTLHSLARSYQRGIDDLTYEVIVIDNGSHTDQRLSSDAVASYGPEFRLLDLGDEAVASPTVALNMGIAQSRGDAVAMMIDGAHVLTPGVLRLGMAALDTYEPAIVATQQWYVGPGQQGDAQQAGYDQEAEDKLFRMIKWPIDGYRLFEIGHFIGDRDWFDGIIESNCLFVPRSLLEQVGAFDDSFSMAGGGYANLELFERLGSHPGINAASILGEGSFHQFHGGTTTNVADESVRRDRVFTYGEHFRSIRGRTLIGLDRPVNFVGSMETKAARRTRSRRDFGLVFSPDRDPVIDTTAPPMPVADELKYAAIEAMWDSQSWHDATWLGNPVHRYPTDLHSYQELIVDLKPEVIVWLGNDPGLAGRALFSASLCEQLGGGRVLAVGTADAPTVVGHDRITHVVGQPDDPTVVEQVRNLVGDSDALVFIGLGAVQRVLGAFDAYAPLVPVGGYVVLENTVVNGRPAASGFGPGPREAAVEISNRHREFVPDVAYERYTITFNKGGFLRRTALS